MFHFLILVTLFVPRPQDSCTYDERCGAGMCLAWEDGRQVCNPKSYDLAVWNNKCIDKIEVTLDTRIEAPLNFDRTPDKNNLKLVNPKVTFKPDCDFKIETRTH